VVLLGLGSLEDGPPACRHQFGLATLLAREVERLGGDLPRAALLAYDPAFTELDWEVLSSGGWQRPPAEDGGGAAGGCGGGDEGGGGAAARAEWWGSGDGTTLFFMPHCHAELYEGVLAENWSRGALGHVAILGNSFEEYDLRWSMPRSMGKSQRRPDRLLSLVPRMREVRIPDGKYSVVSAFNSLSLHTFPPGDLPPEGDAFWAHPPAGSDINKNHDNSS